MKLKDFFQRFGSLPLTLASLLTATVLVAVLSSYSGLITMQIGVDGGQITVDGRP